MASTKRAAQGHNVGNFIRCLKRFDYRMPRIQETIVSRDLKATPISIAGDCRLCTLSLRKLLPAREKTIGFAECVFWYA
jgi:hypothetical protein